MELADQGSLLDFLRKQNSALEDQLQLDLLRQLADAMAELSRLHIIHRDLAARNCLMFRQPVGSRGNQPLVLKLADFGLSRFVGDREYYRAQGNTALPVKWMAPEAFWGKHTSASDVWSYGVVCYEVYSGGQTPWESLSTQQLATAIKQGIRLPSPSNSTLER